MVAVWGAVRRVRVQAQPKLCVDFECSLGYMR